MASFHIGISGWRYVPWRGEFYPKGLKQKLELPYASSKLSSIELNGSFYALQRPKNYQEWYGQTPAGFVFAVKAPRFITHIRRLKDVEGPIANFFASGLLCLKDKLGPILWQFPPNLKFDPDRFEPFLASLPHTTAEMAKMAEHYEPRMKGRAWTGVDESRPVRHAIEIRHESFRDESFVKLLKKHDVAIVVADSAGRYLSLEDVTADFVYCRLHGAEELYVSGYTDAALDHWAERVRAWQKGGEPADAQRVLSGSSTKRGGRDVYVYFDNDAKVKSPRDAMGLMKRLGVEPFGGGAEFDAPDDGGKSPPKSDASSKKRASSGKKRAPRKKEK